MPAGGDRARRGISTYNEKPLHAALKQWYARPADAVEAWVDGYQVDVVRGDLLIEIQTGGFSAIRPKLRALTASHPLRLVHPIARDKWIVRQSDGGRRVLGRRRSPKHGVVEDVFEELVYLPGLLERPNFSVEVLLVLEEEVRRHEPDRAWRRRGWVVQERRLLEVAARHLFETPADLVALIPDEVAEPFSTADLAAAAGRPRRLGQKMAYCLRHAGAIRQVAKRRNSRLYVRAA